MSLGQHPAIEGRHALARPFVDALRASGLALPHGLVPLTLAFDVVGDRQWRRAAAVASGDVAGRRLLLDNRLGPLLAASATPGPSWAGLALLGIPARGVVVELPILPGALGC